MTKLPSILKKARNTFTILVLTVVVITPFVVAPIDYSPLKTSDYYLESQKILSDFQLSPSDTSEVTIGWAKENITPGFPAKIVGYGKNDVFKNVIDSLHVRTFAFKQKDQLAVFICLDIMIIHPFLAKNLEQSIKTTHPEVDYIYFSASHSHNSIGGYADRLAGKFALGGKDDKIITFLIDKTKASIKQAIANLTTCKVNYKEIDASPFVHNRLRGVENKDSKIRIVEFLNSDNKRAALFTFAAHPTTLPRELYDLSGDYPSIACKELVANSSYDFAAFAAGAVGSHAPTSDISIESSASYGKKIATLFSPTLEKKFNSSTTLTFGTVHIPLRSPHLKLWGKTRLRPWLFNKVMGEASGKLSFLQLGEIVFVGTPCDFSGELNLELLAKTKEKDFNLVVTSFNGEYLGYITPDPYYDWDTHEMRDVNWFGPYNGQYFTESILHILEKIE